MNEILTGESRTLLRRNLQDPIASKTLTRGSSYSAQELLEYVESDQFGLKFDRNFVVSTMAEWARELGRAFFVSQWAVLHAEAHTSFATCDVPFGIIESTEGHQPVGVASPEATKAVPLSARTCLLMSGSTMDFAYRKARAGEVRRINIAVLKETERYSFARDEQHLVSLIRGAGLYGAAPFTQMVVDDLPHPSGDPMKSISVVRRTGRKGPSA